MSIYDEPTVPTSGTRLYCDCPAARAAFILEIAGREVRICADHVEEIARRLDTPRVSLGYVLTVVPPC